MNPVRVRFAPSPTGMLHIGSVRTALFNWLYARHCGGTFILRIEDTDLARNSKEAVEIIFDGLKWLGLDWDEGPQLDGTTKGPHAPYFQSQRGDIYKKYVNRLLEEGKAYMEEGAIKFRTPKTPCVIHDIVCGDITFDRSLDPDLVIQRKDGTPVFHLVNVVDDIEMQITHVIRGEDHISNTPKHLALFEAFGAPPPHYGHIPLILNTNGSKMSKRDQGASVGDYIQDGYLPEALRNYLCLLGWSLKENREIFDTAEAVEKFEPSEIHRGNARFDINKLYWMNGEYWQKMVPANFLSFAKTYMQKHGKWPTHADEAYLHAALQIVHEKTKLGRDLLTWMDPFLTEEFEYEPNGLEEVIGTPETVNLLKTLHDKLKLASDFSANALETLFKSTAAEQKVKTGALVHPCRMAVSGRKVGPSLYHMLEVMGQKRVLARIERTLNKIKELTCK